MSADFQHPVTIYRASGLPEAHAVRLLLEQAGIPVRIDNELLPGVVGELPMGWVTAPRIIVARSQEAAAREVVGQFLRRPRERPGPGGKQDSDCLACGADMGEEDVCRACGWSYREEEPP
ncbi:MAG TPA: DUF2007 domain-containing protein [Gemmataceae bacterium]|nr:DUF2007 domain-containing protein [Gemmataceae bacterium]